MLPPPLVKEMIVKTALHVDRNGREFEHKILQSDSSSKFTFLNASDIFHRFYEFVLEHIDDFKEKEVEVVEPEKPRRELAFHSSPLPAVTSKDLEIIKLCALFAAANPANVDVLRQQYGGQLQYKFLDEDNSLHAVFRRFTQQYSAVIRGEFDCGGTPGGTPGGTLPGPPPDTASLLQDCFKRMLHNKFVQQHANNTKELSNLLKIQFLSINWDQFEIVETIEFSSLDLVSELEPPLSRQQLLSRSLEDKQRASELKQDRLVECPITKQLIPESKLEAHLKILLRDTKTDAERSNYEEKIRNTNLSFDIDNIKGLFKKRKLK